MHNINGKREKYLETKLRLCKDYNIFLAKIKLTLKSFLIVSIDDSQGCILKGCFIVTD